MEGITEFAIVCQKLNIPFVADQIISDGGKSSSPVSWRDGDIVAYQNGQFMAVATPDTDKAMDRLCIHAERLVAPKVCQIARANTERQEARFRRPSFW